MKISVEVSECVHNYFFFQLKFYSQVIEDSIKCDPIKQMSWNLSSNFISLLWKPLIAAETCRKRDDIISHKVQLLPSFSNKYLSSKLSFSTIICPFKKTREY